jgi:hypothetical protein
MILLGLLTLTALLPILPFQSEGGPLLPRLATIACAFVVGQMFRHAAEHETAVLSYVGAFVLAGVPWGLYFRWKHDR